MNINELLKKARNAKLQLWLLLIMTGICMFILYLAYNYAKPSETPEPYKTFGYAAIIVFIICSSLLFGTYILEYLNTGKSSYVSNNLSDYSKVQIELKNLKKEFSNLLKTSSPSKELGTIALAESIHSQALLELPEKLVQTLENKFASKVVDKEQLLLIRERLSATRFRFEDEIRASGRRSNLNLSIGIIVTLIAAGLLTYIAFGSKPDFGESLTTLLSHYIPRITTIVFIEVFAFFFLRLYKSGLQEIKYFQNELTNIEMQLIAIEASFVHRHNKSLEGIIEQLMKTERNPFKQLTAEKDEGNLSVKDVNSVIETLSKVTGKS